MRSSRLQASRLVESEPNLTFSAEAAESKPLPVGNNDSLLSTLNLFNNSRMLSSNHQATSFIRQNLARLRHRINAATANRLANRQKFGNNENSLLGEDSKDTLNLNQFFTPSKLSSLAGDADKGEQTNSVLKQIEANNTVKYEIPDGDERVLWKQSVIDSKDSLFPAAHLAESMTDVASQQTSSTYASQVSIGKAVPQGSSAEKPFLVLDLDETLIHSSLVPRRASDFWIEVVQAGDMRSREIFWVYKRPGVDRFLAEMSKHYTLYVFTAGIREYASQILDRLDPTGTLITGRLYRDECSEIKGQGSYAKDLTKICKDLSKVVLVDNTPACYSLQPSNGLPIKSWYTDLSDSHLARLGEFLVGASHQQDMREVLKSWTA